MIGGLHGTWGNLIHIFLVYVIQMIHNVQVCLWLFHIQPVLHVCSYWAIESDQFDLWPSEHSFMYTLCRVCFSIWSPLKKRVKNAYPVHISGSTFQFHVSILVKCNAAEILVWVFLKSRKTCFHSLVATLFSHQMFPGNLIGKYVHWNRPQLIPVTVCILKKNKKTAGVDSVGKQWSWRERLWCPGHLITHKCFLVAV